METKKKKKSFDISDTVSFILKQRDTNKNEIEKIKKENENLQVQKNYIKNVNEIKKEAKDNFFDISIALDNIPRNFEKEKSELKKSNDFLLKIRKRKYWKIQNKKKNDLKKKTFPVVNLKTPESKNDKTLKKTNIKLLLSDILKRDFQKNIKYKLQKKKYLKKGKSIFFKKGKKEFRFFLFNEDIGKLDGDPKLKNKIHDIREDEDFDTDEELLKKATSMVFNIIQKSTNFEIKKNLKLNKFNEENKTRLRSIFFNRKKNH